MARRASTTVVRDALRRRGYDLVRFTRMQLIEQHRIDIILDVGANIGQFAEQVRRLGYSGRIVSFEPLSAALPALRSAAEGHPQWEVRGYALGDEGTTMEINVSENLVSSSLLSPRRALANADPTSTVASVEQISVRRLDDVFDEVVKPDERVLLKLDVQGYERHVLRGAEGILPRIAGLHLEVSLVELYEGEFLLAEALRLLEDMGFRLATLEPGFPDPNTGQLLQVDLTLFR